MHQHIKKLIVPAMLTIGTSFAAVIVDPTVATKITGTLDYPASLSINGSGISSPAAIADGVTDPGNLGTAIGSMPTSKASYEGNIRWYAAPTVQNPFVVTYELAGTNTLNGIYLWNYQEEWSGTYYGGRGIKDVTISFSTDGGTNWGAGTAITFAKAADSMDVAPGFVALSNVSANAVKLTVTSNYGDANRTGFNEIRFTAVPEPASLVLLALTTVTLLRRRR